MRYGVFIILITLFFTNISLAETQINNDISGNVQWLKVNSPYIINKSIKIKYGATLSIEGGTEIQLKNDVKFIAEGTLNIAGEPANHVTFKGFNNSKWDYLEIKNKAVISYLSLSNGGSNNFSPLVINGNEDIVVNNLNLSGNLSNTIGVNPEGTSNLYLYNLGYDYLFNKNLVINEYVNFNIFSNVRILIAKDVLIRIKGNIFANGKADEPIVFKSFNGKWGGLYFDDGSEGKFVFTEFSQGGSSLLTQNSLILSNGGILSFELCSFENSQATAITILKSTVNYFSNTGLNKFINFKKPNYAITNLSTSDIIATNNCFGTTDSNAIDDMIYDGKDRTGKGLIDYLPIADNCDLQIPDVPILLAPVNKSVDIPINLNLRWRNNLYANRYIVNIYEDASISEPLKSITLNDTSVAFFNLDYGTTYYWRVSGVNSIGEGEFSELFSFVTYDTSKPKAPNIIYPPDNELINCQENFIWQNVKNADFYYFEIANDVNFKDVVYNDSTLKYDTLRYVDLDFDRDYFWRIRGKNRNGFGDWSSPISFKTKAILNIDKSYEFEKTIIDIKYFNNKSSNIAILSHDNSFYYIDLLDSMNNLINIYTSENMINDFIFCDTDNDNTLEYVIFHKDYFITRDSENFIFNTSAYNPQLIDIDNDTKTDLIYTDSSGNKLLIDYDYINKSRNIEIITNISSNYVVYDIDRNSYYDIILFSGNDLICFLNDGNKFSKFVLSEDIPIGDIYIKNNDYNSNIDILITNNILSIIEINNELSIVNYHTYNNAANNIILQNVTASNHSNLICLINGYLNIYHDYNFSNNIYKSDSNYNKLIYQPHINRFLIAWNSGKIDFYSINKCTDDFSPTPPDNLRYTYSNDDIILEWSHPTDDYTQAKSLKYALEIINDNTKEYVVSKLFSGRNLLSNNYIELNNIPEGKYLWRVIAIDNAGNFTSSEPAMFKTKGFSSGPPESWYFEKKTGNNSLLILRTENNPMFNGRKFVTGDAVGVFYFRDSSLVCGGYGIWEDGQNMPITAWGDNYQTDNVKDGFELAEDFRFKFWDSFLENEYDISFDIQSGLTYFKPDTITILGGIVEPDTQNIILYPNTINLISSAIIPYNNIIDLLFNNQQIYNIKGFASEKATFWKSNSGYEVFSEFLDTITFKGTLIEPNNFSVNIMKNQWQLIPNPTKYIINVDSLFKNVNALLVNDQGQLYLRNANYHEFDKIGINKSIYCYSFENVALNYHTLKYSQTSDISHIPTISNYFHILIVKFNTILNGIITIKNTNNNIITEQAINSDTAVLLLQGKNDTQNNNSLSIGEEFDIYFSNSSNSDPVSIQEIIDLRDSTFVNKLNFTDKSVYKINTEINNTSVSDSENNNFKIYPNPAKNTLFLENYADKPITAYYLYDNRGRIVQQGNCNCMYKEIDLSKLSSGKYTLHVNYSTRRIEINILIIK